MFHFFEARGDPGRGVDDPVSLGLLDQPKNHDRIVAGRFQAFADETSARVGALAGHGRELSKTFAE
jgi:hypothetical protein